MATPYETLYQKYLKEYEAKQNESIAASDAVYDSQIKTIEDTYNQNINKAKQEYEDDYRANAVQKKVNEFYIAEDMANMGLTNSGLSRMQVTANNLSYANNKAKLDRQRQSMVDSLTMEMTNLISSAKTEKLSAAQGIRDSYAELAAKNATTAYEAELEADTEKTKAYYSYLEKQAKANEENKIALYDYAYKYKNASGVDVNVYYKDGKKYELARGRNPYTNSNNTNDAAVKKYGTFDNGYQPKGVVIDGVDYGKLKKSGETDVVNGRTQNVWITKDGTKWIWDGTKNKYLLYGEG